MRASEFIIEVISLKDRLPELKQLWLDGWRDIGELAELLGLSKKQVTRLLAIYYQDRPDKKTMLGYAVTPADEQEILKKWLAHTSAEDIGSEYGISHTMVFKIAKKYLGDEGYARELKNRTGTQGYKVGFTPEDKQEMGKLYSQGKSTNYIGDKFNVHSKTVVHHLKSLPNYDEIRQQYIANSAAIKKRGPTVTSIHRPGTIGNQRSKGPGTIHTSGVNWPKYG
jgi:DNA-binding CsgD family transcriptional regulator